MRFDMRNLPLIMILSGTLRSSLLYVFSARAKHTVLNGIHIRSDQLNIVLCAELNKLWIAIAKLFRLQNVMKDYLSAITDRLSDVIAARREMPSDEVLSTSTDTCAYGCHVKSNLQIMCFSTAYTVLCPYTHWYT